MRRINIAVTVKAQLRLARPPPRIPRVGLSQPNYWHQWTRAMGVSGVLFLILPSVAGLAAKAGKGFGAKAAVAKSSPPQKPSFDAFRGWAEKEGAKALVPLSIQDFEGERGVAALETVEAGAAILQVPARMSLQVNTLSKPPRWFKDEDAWAASKWDHRLAMMVLHEDGDTDSELKPWLAQLPREFCTPTLSPGLLTALDSIGCFGSVCKAARAQREDWDTARLRAPESPSQAQFDWAMSVVRSRSFSGPFTPSTFVGSLCALSLSLGASNRRPVYPSHALSFLLVPFPLYARARLI